MEDIKDIVMRSAKKDLILELLKKEQRLDGRKNNEFRKTEVIKDVIETAEGSALAKIGETQVLAAVKFDIVTPFPDFPDEGVLITNAEFSPLASPTFEPGPPNEDSIELARVVDRGIRSAEIIDMKELFLEEGKVMGMFLDIYVLDDAGNMVDAAALASIAAFNGAKIPKYEDGTLIRDEYKEKLKPKRFPIATTFSKIDNYLLVDPTNEEEVAADGIITITTCKDLVCTIQKGKGWLNKDDLFNAMDIAFKKASELRKYV